MVDWKKEIKLGGKKKQQDATAREAVDAVEQPEKSEQTSIWKKELTFGRKPKPDSDLQTSIWKKELSFGRKPRPTDAPVDLGDDETAPLDLDGPAAVELVQAYLPDSVAAGPPVELVPDPIEQVFPVAVPDLESEPATPPAVQFVDLLAPTLSEPVGPEPTAVAEAPAPTPPARARIPEAVVVHPPVPAAQLPRLRDEPEPKAKKAKRPKKEQKRNDEDERARVPFYKRELSFRRKPKDAAAPAAEAPASGPEEAKQPKQKRTGRSFSIPRPSPRSGRPGKLPKRVVGLKIGASQLAAATVSNNGHAEVLQVAREALPPGIVSNGELRDPDQLAEALKAFFKKHKLPKRGVRLGIATNRIGVRTLEISGVEDAKQLANAIKFRAQEALPIPIDEAVLDYQVLSETKNEEGETVRRILLVLAYRDLIDRYVAACKNAGIQLVGIDLEAFALLRALAAPRDEASPAQAALVAVTVGHDRTTFAVSDGRICEFTRVLDWGGHTLNVGLARALDMAPSEVDHFKRELSLHGTEVPDGLRDEQAVKAREALNRQVQSFARELVSSLQFYQNQPGSLGIGEIVLTGGTAHLGGFAGELERLTGVRVRVGDPLARVRIAKKLGEPEQLGSLSVAIGLGIED